MEIGHAAQNVCLQAVALALGTVVIGAFRDDEVKPSIQVDRALTNAPKSEHGSFVVPKVVG